MHNVLCINVRSLGQASRTSEDPLSSSRAQRAAPNQGTNAWLRVKVSALLPLCCVTPGRSVHICEPPVPSL